MKDPKTIPVIRCEFTLPDGSVLTQNFTMQAVEGHPLLEALKSGPPDWLDNPRRSWDHPQDPITYKGDVKPGREEEVRAMFDWVQERSRFPDVRLERDHLPSTPTDEEQT